jgi:hypothetical protein
MQSDSRLEVIAVIHVPGSRMAAFFNSGPPADSYPAPGKGRIVLNADKIFALAYIRVLYILENYELNE